MNHNREIILGVVKSGGSEEWYSFRNFGSSVAAGAVILWTC